MPPLTSFFPFLTWLPKVNRRTFKKDLVAGITGAIIVLPQGIAFATIAGLPPEYGLYSAMVPAIIAALFGSSHHLVSGPTTAISIVIFTTLNRFAEPSTELYIKMALTLSFLAGIFQLSLGIFRLGKLTNFVSHSVVVGFTAGAAILIATSQLGNLLGISIPKGDSFLHTWIDIYRLSDGINPYCIAVALPTLFVALILKRYFPRFPNMLGAMVLGGILSVLLDASSHGVKLIGSLPGHLPPLSYPDLSIASIRNLSAGALAIAMLGLAEAVSIARSVAIRSAQQIDGNQEFIGQGLSNMVGSFFSCYASSGSFTRTGLNYESGAQTPMAVIYSAAALAIILILISPLTAYLPTASMAAILLLVAYNLVDIHHIKSIFRTSRAESGVLMITLLSTLFVELEFAIYIGVLLSLLMYLNRTSHPAFVTLAPDPCEGWRPLRDAVEGNLPECPQLKIVRLDGSLFFGAVNHVAEELHRITIENPEQPHILIVGSGVNFIDVSGCEMLYNQSHKLRLEGRQLYFCSFKKDVMDVLIRGGYVKKIGEQLFFHSKLLALKDIIGKLDPERCRRCHKRIFRECAELPAPKTDSR